MLHPVSPEFYSGMESVESVALKKVMYRRLSTDTARDCYHILVSDGEAYQKQQIAELETPAHEDELVDVAREPENPEVEELEDRKKSIQEDLERASDALETGDGKPLSEADQETREILHP